jgi:hypothetical protein
MNNSERVYTIFHILRMDVQLLQNVTALDYTSPTASDSNGLQFKITKNNFDFNFIR